MIKAIYALADSPFYGKIGISGDPRNRIYRINRATKRNTRKLIALPFLGAEAWESLMLAIWPRWSRRAPLGAGKDAGRTEWRWLPFPFLAPAICAAMVSAAFILQAYLLTNAALLTAGYKALSFYYPAQGWLWLFAGYNLVEALRAKSWFALILALLAAFALYYFNFK